MNTLKLGFQLSLAVACALTPAVFGADALNPTEEKPDAADSAAHANRTIDDLKLDLIWIRPGTFMMGRPPGEAFINDNEGPQTKVTLTKGYWLGKTPVTQAQYEAVAGSNPSKFKTEGKDAPVEMVSWNDAIAFCKKLTAREQAAGRLPSGYAYTLPTEAQWEYACRAGTTGPYPGDIDAMAWYGKNSKNADGKHSTRPVATKLPNAWGLYDMLGNVKELCLGLYAVKLPGGEVTDPIGATKGSFHTARGGGWNNADTLAMRSAVRQSHVAGVGDDDVGFRLALAPGMP